MTSSNTRSSIASRFLAVALCLAVVSVVPIAAGATSKQDVHDAEAKVKAYLARVADARAQLTELQQNLIVQTDLVDAAEGKLEETTSQLLVTRREAEAAKVLYHDTVTRLNDRAVEAFMGGPGQDFSFVVGSSSLSELSDRLEYVDAVAQSDADLASTVQNTRNRLSAQTSQLELLQNREKTLVEQTRAAREAILANFQQQQDLVAGIQRDLAAAQGYAKKVSKAYQAALRAASSQGYGGGHTSVPLPSGYEGVLERCPVDGPRSFGDGFGAPRYAGGYHLHKGVDILSPYGTLIVAPFDGYAHSDYNSLGGNVVFVTGKFGTVYNAHLQEFTSKSNGPVRAGDVIGLVGDTGDAVGTPHDHFEFHPNVMPSSWPVSAYGYSIVEDAVNPYPLLVAACG